MLDKTKTRIPERFKDHPVFNTFHRGMNFGFMAKRGYYARKDILEQPAKMAAAGVNWTTLNANFCQESFYSTKVFMDFEFSTGELEMADMVKALHDNGIRMLFKPCLTSLDSAWMGNIRFPDGDQQISGRTASYWETWFKSFGDALKYYADFAQRTGIDALIIGAEYYGTEGRSEEWRKVIADVRGNYDGPITYEFTPSSRKAYSLDWFEDLDFLSYSYYPPACPANAEPVRPRENCEVALDEMCANLESRKAKIASICERFNNKPIAFTEIGVRSAHGCIMQPYNYQSETYYDGEEQANYMEAVLRTFNEIPQWMGFYWWKWDETQNRPHYHLDPKGDMGFTIQGKPAEKVWAKWAGKSL